MEWADVKKEFNNKRVLITGATGIIGSDIARVFFEMKKQGILIDLFLSGRNKDRLDKMFADEKYVPIIGDISELESIPNVDFIIHSAGNSSPDLYVQQPVQTFMGIIAGTNRLLSLARSFSNKVRFIYVSSGEVYGRLSDRTSISEMDYGFIDGLNVRSSYSMGKRAAENLVIDYGKQYGLSTSIVRPSHVFGPFFTENDHRVSADFFRTAHRGNEIVLKSDGMTMRSYTYIRDVSTGVLFVSVFGENGQAYNVSNTLNVVTIREFAEKIAYQFNVPVRFETPNDEDVLQRAQMDVAVLDNTKLMSLGWRPYYSVDRGIAETEAELDLYEREN